MISFSDAIAIRNIFLLIVLGVCNISYASDYGGGITAHARADYATALQLFNKAAAQGNVDARLMLGYMYANGQGSALNYNEAVRHWKLAAAQRNVRAQANLGIAYFKGQGAVKSYMLAYMWLSLASIEGDMNFIRIRDTVLALMTPRQIAEAQKLATECQARNFKGCDR